MTDKPQLRISSGTVKNKKLNVPDIPNFRPVQEVAKQAIFAIIGDKIQHATCADIFAGSGNMGIEALSRGADWCDFVDNSYEAEKTIEQNLFNCDFLEKAEIFGQAATKFTLDAQEIAKQYDIIFMDPFYNDTAQIYLLKQIPKILKADGVAVLLYGDQLDIGEVIDGSGLVVTTSRKFGASNFSILKNQ